MTVNKIDVDKNKTTLTFDRHEIHLIRRALQAINTNFSEEEEFFLIELSGVDDIMKDGNFTRFLSFYKSSLEKISEN